MRRTPSPNHLLAAAVAAADATSTAGTTTTLIMSSCHHYRGRGRGFSGRSYSSGRGQNVTGDDHFRSVRDTNLGLRRGERGRFSNQTPSPQQQQQQYQNQSYHRVPPPPQLQNQSYNRAPPPPQLQYQSYNRAPLSPQLQNCQFRHAAPQFRPPPPQYDHRRPAFRPLQNLRPRPPDYREWELATAPPPPPHCERFIIVSYNILADYLALDHRSKLYFHIPRHILDWQWRKKNLIFELGLWSADIMCLQEVDRFDELAEELKLKGYSGCWKMRTGNPVDGCAIFWRTSRFNLLYEECIEFNKLGLRDNVAQICVLEFKTQNGSVPSSTKGSSKVVVCNTHVLYNPNRGEIKLGQVRVLIDRAKAVSELWNNAPVVICGDFNCTPKSPLYNFISEQKLDLSGIDRNKVSGQASAVICASRFYGPNSRSANGSVQTTSNVGDEEVNIEQNNSLSDMQNPDSKSNSSENQFSDTISNMPDKSLTNVQHDKESDAYAIRDVQDTAVDHCKTFGEIENIEESNPTYSEEHVLDTVQSLNQGASSEHVSDAVTTSKQESSSKISSLHFPEGNGKLESECSSTSLQEDDHSSRVNIDLESSNILNEEICSTPLSSQNSVSDSFEEPDTGCGERLSDELLTNDKLNSSSTSVVVDKSHQSANIDFPLEEKLEKLFFDEVDKTIGNENMEDDTAFISSFYNTEEGASLDRGPSMKSNIEKSYKFEESESASNLLLAESNEVDGDLSSTSASEYVNAERTTYNPSFWTPMDIETATGNSECTFLEHPLPLRSTYTEAMDSSGTRDPHGEPLVTSYNRCFLGTVDYIWRSEGLQTTRVLAPIPKHAMEWTPGFPTKKWGSDHIALASELAILKDGTQVRNDV
ncbi:hypothetical protein HN51_041942 [Arachis hypogaea]|uniref:Endonuclease/exonuclease/phosphatase domain-containing protein n=2 Tax=Arachis TaxID=3817 RepID=A0A444YUT2_ARAHY|nr:carbon catabolite repressor protein 4 homolog 6 isoform X1 [Arachis duranensis]XP_025606423.1 carbon catabolite repressor protein 4 homolog 6 isoform X1 [Arachis hypogaea]QHN87792.1 uncharacterized protein DS421_16g558140 [Arachis hypogaea]RYR05691.1 hypothetical protein Ahy_B06g085523 isoform B [Arachis hypogaea]